MDDYRCYWCEYDERGDPCLTGGVRDYERMAQAYIAYWERNMSGEPDEDGVWICECVSELEREAPRAALWFLLLALDRVTSARVLAVLAAGPMENALCYGGLDIIAAVEALAGGSPKFRLLVSGCWGRNRMDEEVWRRASAAVAEGPRFCDDPRTIGHGGAGREASESEIGRLLTTSAIDDLGGKDAARAMTGLPMPECGGASTRRPPSQSLH